jgi:hypothetical protein
MRSYIANIIKPISAGALLLMVMCAMWPHHALAQDAQTTTRISAALSNGSATVLASLMNNTVALTLPDSDGTYSKKQAEQLIKMFFEQNPVSTFTTEHNGTSTDGSCYMIGDLLTTKQKTYRVYVLTKQREGIDLIHQLQIEAE